MTDFSFPNRSVSTWAKCIVELTEEDIFRKW